MFRLALKPLNVVSTSVLTFLILLVATRTGQFADIAGYSAGASLGALISAFVGSGTSLAYVTGDSRSQAAVRRVRHFIVAPAMLMGALAAALIYEAVTQIAFWPVLFGGVTVAFNNLAELEASLLERKLETARLLLSSVLARVSGLLLILLSGLNFSGTMLVVAVLGFSIQSGFARKYNAPRASERVGLRASVKLAYEPSLMSISVLGAVVNRAVLVALPFVMSADDAGVLSTLISAQQMLTAVTVSSLYTLMAVRVERGAEQAWMQRADRLSMVASAALAVISVLATPIVLRVLSVIGYSDSGVWWILLSLAIFPYTHNRRRQYALLADSLRRQSAILLGILALATVISSALGVALAERSLLAGTSLLAESTTMITFMMWSLWRGNVASRWHRREGASCPRSQET